MARQIKTLFSFFPKVPNGSTFIISTRWPNTFGIFTPQHFKDIKIVQSSHDLVHNVCNSCEYFVEISKRKDATTEMLKEVYKDSNAENKTAICKSQYLELFDKTNKCFGMTYYTSNEDKVCKKGLSVSLDHKKRILIPPVILIYNAQRKKFFYNFCKVEEEQVKTSPFDFANVYSNGEICWGNYNKNPSDLAQAYQLFWNAPFNSDLVSNLSGSLHQTLEQKHRLFETAHFTTTSTIDSKSFFTRTYDEDNTLFLSSHSAMRVNSPNAAIITTDAKIVDNLPEVYKHNLMLNEQKVEKGAIAWVKTYKDGWVLHCERNGTRKDGSSPPYVLLRKSKKLNSASSVIPVGELDQIV